MQLAEFRDGPEDGNPAECDDRPASAFQELDRQWTSSVDMTGPESAVLSFTVVGNKLTCELVSTTGITTATAIDDSFTDGTVGFSTMNMYGKFHYISVCEVLGE